MGIVGVGGWVACGGGILVESRAIPDARRIDVGFDVEHFYQPGTSADVQGAKRKMAQKSVRQDPELIRNGAIIRVSPIEYL